MVIAMMGPTSSRAPKSAACSGVFPSRMCRSTFSTTTMASSTTRPTDENDGEQGEQVQREPEGLHQEHRADERHRDRDQRHEHRAQRAEEQEDDHDDDEHRLEQRLASTSSIALLMYLVESKAMLASMPVGSSFRIASISLRTRAMTSSELALGSTHTPMNTALLPGEAHFLIVGVGAEHHLGDVLEAHQRAVLLTDHELLELVHRVQIGGGGEVLLKELPLGLPDRRQVVVGRKRLRGLAPGSRSAPPCDPASTRRGWRTCGRRGCRRAARPRWPKDAAARCGSGSR